MAHKHKQDMTGWEKFSAWIKSNEKILFVMLLAAVSFTFAFPQLGQVVGGRQATGSVLIFGESVPTADLQVLATELQAAQRLAVGFFGGRRYQTLARLNTDGSREIVTPQEFYIYLHEAREIGIEVSDAELGARRRDLWRSMYAGQKAAEEAQGIDPNDRQAIQMAQFSAYRIAGELREANAFDSKDWKKRVYNATKMSSTVFEEALRKVMTVAKLDEYIRSSVAVSDKDVFERFLEEQQQRQLSWLQLEPSDDLKSKFESALSDEDLKKYLAANRAEFRKDLSIRCDYLIVPREHFAEEVKKELKDEDLKTYYESNLSRYIRSEIALSEDMTFTLLSSQEIEKQKEKIYKPFDEVKEEVEEKLVDDRSLQRVREFTNELAAKLFPQNAAATSPTFEQLAKEHPFLVAGKVLPTTKLDAKEGFGDAFSFAVNGWFSSAAKDENGGDLTDSQRNLLKRQQTLTDRAGYVFYRRVEVLDPRDPEFDEIRGEIVETLAQSNLLAGLVAASEAKSLEINDGKLAFEDLAGVEIDVEVSTDVKAKATFTALSSALNFVKKSDFAVRIPKAPEEDIEGDAKENDDASSSKSDEDEETSEVQDSSIALIAALFAIEEKGKAGVAEDVDESTCYLVRFDDFVKPDSADFELKKSSIRYQLTNARESDRFNVWRENLLNEAGGNNAAPPTEDDLAAVN